MKLFLLLLGCGPLGAWAQLEWMPPAAPQQLFAGRPQIVQTIIRNAGDAAIILEVQQRLFQLSAATALPVGPAKPWKQLHVLPQQTVIENVALSLPAVNAPTRFRVVWFDPAEKTIGGTDVIGYPETLLAPLRELAGGQPLGVLEIEDWLGPELQKAELPIQPLATAQDVKDFSGRLLFVNPGLSREPMKDELLRALTARAREGLAIVWFKRPNDRPPPGGPAIYVVPLGNGTIVMADPASIAGLVDRPAAHLMLVHLAELAARPDLLSLPGINTSMETTP